MRREITAEMALQGLIAGIIAVGLLSIGSGVLAHISISLPTNLPGENPATFAPGGFQAVASKIALPVSLTIWDWLSGPIIAIVALGICGWWMSGDAKTQTLWSAIRAA